MGPKTQEVGGGASTGLANDFVKILQQGINTGSFGGGTAGQQAGAADPTGSTQGVWGVLNDILSGGAGNLGGALGQMISKETDRNAGALRSRFDTGGGTAFGTPAAFGEALLRSESAPKIASTIGGLQLGALQSILGPIAGLSGAGTAPRETIASPSTFSQIAQIGSPIIAAILKNRTKPGIGGQNVGGNIPNQYGGVAPGFGTSVGARKYFPTLPR